MQLEATNRSLYPDILNQLSLYYCFGLVSYLLKFQGKLIGSSVPYSMILNHK